MSDKFNMDGHKLLWHLDRVLAWQKGERIAPLHIDLGISKGCNMACTYCYGVIQGRTGYGTDIKAVFNMPEKTILALFEDAKRIGVRSIALIGEGENTLNPALPRALEFARSIDLDVSLATNGVRLASEHDEIFLRALTWLRFNISAANAEAFKRIHRTDHFDRVLDNVRRLVAVKRRIGAACTLGLQMVVTGDNFDQIVPLAELGRELGVDYFVIKPCSDTPDGQLAAPHETYVDRPEIFEQAAAFSTPAYTVIPKLTKLMDHGQKDYPVCFGTQFIIAISADGRVFPCGHWFDIRQDEFVMGNCIDEPFADIVASERYWEVQKRVNTVAVNHECETNCRQHYINQFLWKLSSQPDHLNFV
jgi:radical SAM protein with 4Fe4S-binding SPASM domain